LSEPVFAACGLAGHEEDRQAASGKKGEGEQGSEEDDGMIWLLGGYMWLFVHRPFEVWPALGAMQIERAYMIVLILAWLVAPGKGFVLNRIHVALALFTAVLLSAWVLSPYADKPGCLDAVENYVKVSVFYFLVVTTVRDERGLRLLVLLFLASVSLYMTHSILEMLNGRYQWRMGIRRMVGVDLTFSDPNAFASTLLYTLPLTLPFWREQPRRIPRFVLVGYTLAVCFCILMTGSRAGFLGLCGLSGLILVASAKQKGQVIVVGAFGALVAFAVLSVVLPGELQERYLTIVDSSQGPENARVSASGRLAGFLEGIRVWQASPLLGHGPASFAFATGREGQAHNVYGQVLSELGTLGALVFLLLVYCFFRNWLETRQLRAATWPPPNDFAANVVQAVGFDVILLLVMGWAGHNLYRYNWQWFAAFQAIALHCVRLRASAAAHACAPSCSPWPSLRLGEQG
jgi:O-antigen ligase